MLEKFPELEPAHEFQLKAKIRRPLRVRLHNGQTTFERNIDLYKEIVNYGHPLPGAAKDFGLSVMTARKILDRIGNAIVVLQERTS